MFKLTVVQGAQLLEAFMRRTGAKLGGTYPNCNHGFAMGDPPTKEKAFVIGDFIVVDPSSTVRFDELMCLKEDYDFTVRLMCDCLMSTTGDAVVLFLM